MNTKSYTLLILLIFAFQAAFSQSEIITYPAPPENFSAKSDRFLVTLYKDESDTKGYASYVYVSKAGNATLPELGQNMGKTFNYNIFSFSGNVIVEVTKLYSNANSATLRPERLKLGVIKTKKVRNGRAIRFKLDHTTKISVEFDDDPSLKDAMMVFANPLENSTAVPSQTAPNVLIVKNEIDLKNIPNNKTIVYFPAGVFEIGYWDIPSYIKQVYVSGGAFVRGYFMAERSKAGPITLNGRGVVSNDIYTYHYPESRGQVSGYTGQSKNWYKLILVSGGAGHVIEGLTLVDGSAFNIELFANNSTVENVNIQGFKYNNDGITTSGNNDKINNSFLYLNEDAIILYGNSITITNCTFWELLNGIIVQLGWYTHNITGKNIISNCDVLHAGWKSNNLGNVGFIAAMMGSSKNSQDTLSVIENFDISNIYFDDYVEKFINIRPEYKDIRREPNIHPWIFRNFYVHDIHLKVRPDKQEPVNNILEFDNSHPIQDFKFENIYVNNKIIDNKTVKETTLFLNQETNKKVQIK